MLAFIIDNWSLEILRILIFSEFQVSSTLLSCIVLFAVSQRDLYTRRRRHNKTIYIMI